MANAAEFSLSLSRFARELLPQQLQDLMDKTALDLLGRIVLRNPVDTGRSRGNWQVGIGQPSETVFNVAWSDNPVGDASETLGGRALSTAFDDLHVFNNVNYVPFIEARYGFVASSVAEIQAAL